MTSYIEIRVSARADREFRLILAYTEQTWGTGQRDEYREILEAAFRRIQQYPEIGRPAKTGREGTREWILPHHIIVYRRSGNIVTILRIKNPRRGQT
jgi:plasmid stabilization system protein ParE